MRKLIVIAGAAAVVAATASFGQANDRYGTRPPVLVSPDLSAPWVMQLRRVPEGRARQRVVVRPADPEPRHIFKRKKRDEVRTAVVTAPKPRKTKTPRMDPKYLPTVVDYASNHKPGTIIINTNERFLYLVMRDGKARRYGVGVGKPGFEWAGTHKVTLKRVWPDWRPPAEMIAREKKKGRHLPTYMAGGPSNPLGARALYLGSTLYRIHGTNQPWTIGAAVSSGCIRMRNEDVVDLYERVPVGTKVFVI